jgi:hypothetical protein
VAGKPCIFVKRAKQACQDRFRLQVYLFTYLPHLYFPPSPSLLSFSHYKMLSIAHETRKIYPQHLSTIVLFIYHKDQKSWMTNSVVVVIFKPHTHHFVAEFSYCSSFLRGTSYDMFSQLAHFRCVG